MYRYVAVLSRKLPQCDSWLRIKIDLNFVGVPGRPVSDGLESHYAGWTVQGYYQQKKDKAS